ncbi:3'(2'),5'-bisphosphate nucleotidase CysQ [uncultured Pontibacter sp.]|uniref:3'(2'),5'-bisphosphate nucleotidase CysQ n=1 Tax=uncultured Pontibacter sp. TaxID=453356 RepID=UPI002635E8DB|nr:3'(2'),5'-bisphosphate nucleotidase CysQ [uncultured Pontibacter sp.]
MQHNPPPPVAIGQLLEIASAAALDAGKAIMKVYLSGDFSQTLKTDNSPLTAADKAAHQVITNHLQRTKLPILSEEGLQADYTLRKDWGWYWLVDPLDGTKEFLKRNGEFTVNIALMQKNTPVAGVIYAPVSDSLYFGGTGANVYKSEKKEVTPLQPLAQELTMEKLLLQPEVTVIASRSHLTPETLKFTAQFNKVQFTAMGSSLKFMLLAENKADIYPRYAPTMEWDTAAAHAILRALGRNIYTTNLQSELVYNKPDLLNPSFIAL